MEAAFWFRHAEKLQNEPWGAFTMAIQVFEFVDVEEKSKALGCNIPTSIALLPRNFEIAESRYALLHEKSAWTIRELFQENGIVETPLERDGEVFYGVVEKGLEEWIAPMIFVSSALLSQNPHIVSVALGVISNHVTDLFRRIPEYGTVRLDIVVETKKKTYMRISYEGPVSGLEKAEQIVTKISLLD